MITRDIGFVVNGMKELSYSSGSTAAIFAATGDNSSSFTAGVSGRIIDRLGDMLAARFYAAYPSAQLYATRGSTEADRKWTLAVKIQHGDSSAGGDMADYSTGSQATDKVFFSTVQTTPMANWSTGPFYGQTAQTYYDLKAAKRYIRTVVTATKNRATTETSGDEGARISASVAFVGGDRQPQLDWRGLGSTSSSTST